MNCRASEAPAVQSCLLKGRVPVHARAYHDRHAQHSRTSTRYRDYRGTTAHFRGSCAKRTRDCACPRCGRGRAPQQRRRPAAFGRMGDASRTGAHAQWAAARAATPARYRAPDRRRARGTAQTPCDPVVQRSSGRGHRRAAHAHARQRGLFPAAGATGRRLGHDGRDPAELRGDSNSARLALDLVTLQALETRDVLQCELVPQQIHDDPIISVAIHHDGVAKPSDQLESEALIDADRLSIVSVDFYFDAVKAPKEEAVFTNETRSLGAKAFAPMLALTNAYK